MELYLVWPLLLYIGEQLHAHWRILGSVSSHGAAQVMLLLLPGGEGAAAVDAAGERALAVLRHLGLPSAIGVVAGAPGTGLKQRAAAKKRATAALAVQACPCRRLSKRKRCGVSVAYKQRPCSWCLSSVSRLPLAIAAPHPDTGKKAAVFDVQTTRVTHASLLLCCHYRFPRDWVPC